MACNARGITLNDFLFFRDEFVKQHGEPKRFGDTLYPECYSCLHKANPNLVPMTFYGMQMLDQLNRPDFQYLLSQVTL
ncbi:MAG: hypothetical protein Ct9H300mP27_04300 [Chloroflexota bacterium]|nr:MAG: hypothetical protein Ct9H300mP27_04300 [Chloroflexota bacterium]